MARHIEIVKVQGLGKWIVLQDDDKAVEVSRRFDEDTEAYPLLKALFAVRQRENIDWTDEDNTQGDIVEF